MAQQEDHPILVATRARDAAADEHKAAQAAVLEKKRELREARRTRRQAEKKAWRATMELDRVNGTRKALFKFVAGALGFGVFVSLLVAAFSPYDGDMRKEVISFDSLEASTNCPGAYLASYTTTVDRSDGIQDERTATRYVNDSITLERIRAAILRHAPLNVTERYHGRDTFLGAFTENICADWYVVRADSIPKGRT